MKEIAKWDIKIKRTNHQIILKRNWFTSQYIVMVDEKEVPFTLTLQDFFKGLDMPLKIKNNEIRLIINGYSKDLVVDGKHLKTGLVYEPIGKIPKWTWFFVLLCLALPVMSLGGFIPIMYAIVGIQYVIRTSLNPAWPTSLKVIACLGATAFIWFACILTILILFGNQIGY